MSNKKYFLSLILLLLINIKNIESFKYPINKDLLSSEKGEISSIEISKKSEFDKYVIDNKYVIAIFHADWCGHCKRFLPVFDEASKYKIISNTWKLLKIPCSKYNSLCEAFHIEGYPTVKVFINSKEMNKVSPPRDREHFLEYLIKVSSEPLININNKQNFFNNYGTFSPLVEYNKNKDEFITCIKTLANSYEFLSEYYFGINTITNEQDEKIIFDFDNNNVIFNYKGNCDEVKKFLRNNKYPLISEASFNLMRKINRDRMRQILILFYNSNNDIINKFIENEYKKISRDNREIVFAYSYINKNKDLADYFKIEINKETEFEIFIYDFSKEKFYRHKILDINIINIDQTKDEIINLIKNINKIYYTSNSKIMNFISDHKFLMGGLVILLVIGITYLICCCDVEDDVEFDENEEKEEKEIARKEKKKLINNDFGQEKEKTKEIKNEEINKDNKDNKEKKD